MDMVKNGQPKAERVSAIDRLRAAGPIDEAAYLKLLEDAWERANPKARELIEPALKAARAANGIEPQEG